MIGSWLQFRHSALLRRKLLLEPTRCFGKTSILAQREQKTPGFYDQEKMPKELVSGAPKEMSTQRMVKIYKEAKPATQSSNHNGTRWKLDWNVLGKGNRWEDHLIGYQASADYMQGTIMQFDTKESAIRFAEGQGWDYYVQEPNKRHFRRKEYAFNFVHSYGPLKHIRTK